MKIKTESIIAQFTEKGNILISIKVDPSETFIAAEDLKKSQNMKKPTICYYCRRIFDEDSEGGRKTILDNKKKVIRLFCRKHQGETR